MKSSIPFWHLPNSIPKFTFYSIPYHALLIADIYGTIYFAITFSPLIILQNKIYYKTINFAISVILDMIRSAVSVHSSEFHCSLPGFTLKSQRSLRQLHGEFTANPRRLQCDSIETALRIEKFFTKLKNFCSLATPLRMR